MTNAQAKLNAMKRWPAAKLAAHLPAWYKRHQAEINPSPFKPDLRQVIPPAPRTTLSNEAHRSWLFKSKFSPLGSTTQDYIRAWDLANHFKV